MIEKLFTASGFVTGAVMVLIVIFLFREGLGFFGGSVVESGYVLLVNDGNGARALGPKDIKAVFDGEASDWEEFGWRGTIVPLRMEDVLDDMEEATEELLPGRIGELARSVEGAVVFLPDEYLPDDMEGLRVMEDGGIGFRNFFFGVEWIPTATPAAQFGLTPLLLGTLLVSFVSIFIALPLGLGVSVYLAELSGVRTRNVLKPAIELLAGIPSVVYGFFGLVVIVPVVRDMFDLPVGETAFTGSIILAIMALPTIITVSEDAIRNVPQSVREASFGLGASHWQTIYRVIIPYSASGISAAVVLGIGRAVGETMAVLMVTGNAAVIPCSLFEPVRTIPATIAAELGEAPAGGAHYGSLFVLGCILFVITAFVSVTAEVISARRGVRGAM
jgi:phosphate transport system permease protein